LLAALFASAFKAVANTLICHTMKYTKYHFLTLLAWAVFITPLTDLKAWQDAQDKPQDSVGIFNRFKAAGIEIPYPQRDIHIKTSNVKDTIKPGLPYSDISDPDKDET